MKYENITELIGNTPLLRIPKHVHGLEHIELYAKLEYFNPFGSVKDRAAWGMVKDDIETIRDQKKTIVEASSGNTAKALQMIASLYGVPFQALTNRVKVQEVKEVLQLLGARVEEFPGLSECPDPTVPNDILSTIAERVKNEPDRYYHPSQYTNDKNVLAHYETTGEEITQDLGVVDFLIGGLGTTGSTRGTAQHLKEKNSGLEVIGVVSSKEDFIPGIRSAAEMWEVGLFEKELYSAIVPVTSSDAIDATLALMQKTGMLAGPTTGAAYAGGLAYLREIDATLTETKTAVFIACDRIEWYVSYFKKRRPELFGRPSVDTVHDLTKAQLEKTKSISVDEAKTLIENREALAIDMRGNMAYRVGHIPGAINIPDTQLYDLIANGLPFSRSQKILFMCPLGDASRAVAAFLNERGYETMSLQGGITAWRDAGYTFESLQM